MYLARVVPLCSPFSFLLSLSFLAQLTMRERSDVGHDLVVANGERANLFAKS